MIIKNRIGLTEKKQWEEKWKDIFDHYQQDLRHSYYINAILNEVDKRVLELAAGSFRDMANLNKLGVDCCGTDYSDISVEMAKNQFADINDKIFQSDAFNINIIKDKEFDVTFHNGFWILFDNDEDIIKLAHEQARITKRIMISTVHNAHNKQFVSYFEKLSQTDELYNVRFFEVDEIAQLMLKICKSVEIIPVGKGKKFHEDQMINEGKCTRDELKYFFDKTKMTYLEESERLLCIGYL